MTNSTATDNAIYKGALLILLAELFLVFSGMVIKQISGELPTEIIVFMRNLFGLMLLIPWLLRNGSKAIRTQLLRFHIMRAAVGVTAMSCLFYSWGHLPLAQAALLKQTAPFFMPLIALYWLGESISGRAKLAILVGFIGVYFVLNPHEGSLNFVVIIAVLGAMLGALAKVTIRRMVGTESPQRIVFYFAFFSATLSAIPALLVWQTPTTIQYGWLILLASTSTVAQLLLSKGYSYAPAGQLGPFTYGSVVFAALFGWWIWEESLGWNTWLGMMLITLAGLMAMLKKPPAKAIKN
ncbi:DMT family transporter [Neptunomonas qingdaonensis]|uniref:Permease of the drug/metabolite transporter (DMT) superfamily n=1 Tax=Neptunomonas qingdaonensis TaxID=1045558 RepID=A0A1I2T133_9GAMM|nr:DMT family transporter [Neptunomonas qingdaonensis]SFG57859.1 Permease of the drug/metabolite transporter (DMT) superfamily [Neptunomonas qingdaonensis]